MPDSQTYHAPEFTDYELDVIQTACEDNLDARDYVREEDDQGEAERCAALRSVIEKIQGARHAG